jgi:hypothetical protein
LCVSGTTSDSSNFLLEAFGFFNTFSNDKSLLSYSFLELFFADTSCILFS